MARDFLEAAEGEVESARRGGEAEDPGRAGRKCALCGCGLTGACELDHVVPVRQAFAGSVQTLQALCGDCHSEKTLRESAQPTSLESRVAPGVMEYVRSPRAGVQRLGAASMLGRWRSAKPYDPYDSAGWRVREEHVHLRQKCEHEWHLYWHLC